jgi:hypothetical protein
MRRRSVLRAGVFEAMHSLLECLYEILKRDEAIFQFRDALGGV